MIIQNRTILKSIPFEDYLKMPGVSYSDIKNAGKEFKQPTGKMQLGTNVHNYLLTPHEYNHADVAIVRPIALALKKQLGDLLPYLWPELVVTCNFIHNGFNMLYRGRIDLGIPGRLVIDIKVTEMPIRKGIEYFGYDKQQSGYGMGIDAKVALIIAIHPISFRIDIVNIPINSEWWENQVIQKGEPVL